MIVFKINIQLKTRFELFSSHQYSMKYTNNFFQNLMKPLELYPKAGSYDTSKSKESI